MKATNKMQKANEAVQKSDESIRELTKKYTKTPIRVDLYSLEKLKIALDDLFVEYCKAKGYHEKPYLVDFQNAIGVVSTILAGVVALLSVYFRWEAICTPVVICVAIYYAINTASYALTYVYGGKIVFREFEAVTRIEKTPVYVSLIFWKGKMAPVKYYKSALDLFDETGKLDHVQFLNDMEKLFNE